MLAKVTFLKSGYIKLEINGEFAIGRYQMPIALGKYIWCSQFFAPDDGLYMRDETTEVIVMEES